MERDGDASMGFWPFLNERWGRNKPHGAGGSSRREEVLPMAGPRDVCGAGGAGARVSVYPSGSCPPGSSRLGQGDGVVWKSMEEVPASHLAMGHPAVGIWPRAPIWHPATGQSVWGAWLWGSTMGVSSSSTWTFPPFPPSWTHLAILPWAHSGLGNPWGNPFPSRGGTRWASTWG